MGDGNSPGLPGTLRLDDLSGPNVLGTHSDTDQPGWYSAQKGPMLHKFQLPRQLGLAGACQHPADTRGSPDMGEAARPSSLW